MSCIVKPYIRLPYGERVYGLCNIVAAATIVKAAAVKAAMLAHPSRSPRGRGSTEPGRSRGGGFPADEKVGHRGGLHAAHGLEFASPLTVKELAALAEHSEGRNALAQRNLVALGDVEILIQASDIDVNEDVVGLQKGPIGRVMKIQIKNVAIGAPIAAEVQDDPLVSRGRCGEGRGLCGEGGRQVAFRLTGSRVDVALGGTHGNYA